MKAQYAKKPIIPKSVIDPAYQAPQGLPRLRALFCLWVGWEPRSGLPGGCPMISVSVEVDDREGTLRDLVEKSQTRWFALIQSLVEDAIVCGHLAPQVDPYQFAWEVCGIYLVYHFSLRLLRDPQAEDRAHQAFERLVQSPPLFRKEQS